MSADVQKVPLRENTSAGLACLLFPALSEASGRYKISGNNCVWDSGDDGYDQCSPTQGRWKDDGNGGCYWDGNDSGPNQCAPVISSQDVQDVGALVAGIAAELDEACSALEEEEMADPQQKYACRQDVEAVTGAAIALSSGTNVWADAVGSWCVAADIYYAAKSWLDYMNNWGLQNVVMARTYAIEINMIYIWSLLVLNL